MPETEHTHKSIESQQVAPLHRLIIHARNHQHRAKYAGLVVSFVAILAVGFLGGYLGSRAQNHGGAITVDQQKVILGSEGSVVSNIAKNVGQSVVSVDVTSQATSSTPSIDNLFGFGGSQDQTQTQEDAGTGIILTSSGLIITNRHVIPDGTTSVSVTLSDGTIYNNVQVVGRTADNDSLDIAFLQIQNTNGKTLVPAQLGDSSQMQVGDQVVAIGNALGQFQNTVTSGIISGYGRSVQASDSTGASSENLDDLFQTDAAINEGNSGGPLVNLDGQVIGINTAIASSAENIGFAIPINEVSGIIKNFESTGKLEQPYLGIIYIPITADVASQYNLNVSNGAYIPTETQAGQSTVISGSPAANAGLQPGDIITNINGTPINATNDLTSLLDQQSVGSSVSLTVIRGGKTMNINVTLGSAPTN